MTTKPATTTARRTRTAPTATPAAPVLDTAATVPVAPTVTPATPPAAKSARRKGTATPPTASQNAVATVPTAPAAAPAAPPAATPARKRRAQQPASPVAALPVLAAPAFTTAGQRDQLKEALALLSHVIPAKPTLPILAHVLLRSDGERLTLHASDLRMTIAWTLPWTPSGAGAVTLPAKLLTDLTAVLPSGALDLHCDGVAETTTVRCADSTATIKGWDVDDFPVPPAIDSTSPTFQIDAAALREAITQVVFAAATEETRPVLTGVLFELRDDRLQLSASNGFLLAVKTIDLDMAVDTPQRLVIPATALAELGRVLQGDTEVVRFTVAPSGGQLLMETAQAALYCRLLENIFPDLGRVIPTHVATRAVVARDELRQAVRQAAVFAASSAHVTRLTVEEPLDSASGRVALAARAAELGTTAATLTAQVTGEGARVGLSSRFLKEVLGVLPTPEIAIELEGRVKPVVFRPVGDPSLLIVVMPMNLTD